MTKRRLGKICVKFFCCLQNWRRAHKKRVLFKLGSTLVGEIDVIEERNNNDDDDVDVPVHVADDDDDIADNDDDNTDGKEIDSELANPTLLPSTSSSPTPSTSSSNSGADNQASVYDEILHDEDWQPTSCFPTKATTSWTPATPQTSFKVGRFLTVFSPSPGKNMSIIPKDRKNLFDFALDVQKWVWIERFCGPWNKKIINFLEQLCSERIWKEKIKNLCF